MTDARDVEKFIYLFYSAFVEKRLRFLLVLQQTLACVLCQQIRLLLLQYLTTTQNAQSRPFAIRTLEISVYMPRTQLPSLCVFVLLVSH